MSLSAGCQRHIYIESEGYELMEEEEEDLPVEQIMVGDGFEDYVSIADQVPDIRTVFPSVILTPTDENRPEPTSARSDVPRWRVPTPRADPQYEQVLSSRSDVPHVDPLIPGDDVFAPAEANTKLFLEKVQKMQVGKGPFAPHPPANPKPVGKPSPSVKEVKPSPNAPAKVAAKPSPKVAAKPSPKVEAKPGPKLEVKAESLLEKDKQRKKVIAKVIDDRNNITTAGKESPVRKPKKKKTAGDAGKKKKGKKKKGRKSKKKMGSADQAKKKIKKSAKGAKIRKAQSQVQDPDMENHVRLILGQITKRQQEAEQRRICSYFENQRKAQNALMKCDAVEKRREKLRQMKIAELQKRAAEREKKLKAIEKEREKMEEERRKQFHKQMEKTERLASLAMEAKSMRMAASERRKKKAKICVPVPRTYRRP